VRKLGHRRIQAMTSSRITGEPGQAVRRLKPVVDQAVEFRYLERASNPPEPRDAVQPGLAQFGRIGYQGFRPPG